MKLTLAFLAVLMLASLSAADAQPLLATPGKILFEDDFARTELLPKFRTGKGTFTIKDGVLTGAAIPDDKHGAYIYTKGGPVFKDIVAEYSVKFDGGRAFQFILDDSTFKDSHLGHILRATLLPGSIDLADYKFGPMRADYVEKMKDPKVSADERKKLKAEIADKTVIFKNAIDMAQWHLIRVEIAGDEMLVYIDGQPAAYLKSAGIGHDAKNSIRFEINGSSCMLKNVKVWEATLAAEWPAKRDAIIGALKK